MRKNNNFIRKDWFIMGASAWISGKPSIEKIIKENHGKGTIMVVERKFYGDKVVRIFVLGSVGNYGYTGQEKTFIQDTGSGYGKEGICTIQNIIEIDEDKIIDGGNGIGLDEKRPLWVFK